MSYIGTTKIGKMYLGDTEIAKAYLGSNLVFSRGSGPQPTTIPYIRGGADGSYIDTGIIPDETTKVIVWARNWNPAISNNTLFGQFDSYGYGFAISLWNATSTGSVGVYYGSYNNPYVMFTDAFAYLGGYHKYELSSAGFKIDDVTKASVPSRTLSIGYSMHLFGNNGEGTHANMALPADICACKIYKNNVLVRNYTAVNSPSVGLYDSVSGQVFTNVGSGSFTYGTFNQYAYTPLEYISCTAQQYFDTGLYGNNSTKVVTKIKPTNSTKTYNRLYGTRNTEGGNDKMTEVMLGNTSVANSYFYYGYGSAMSTFYNSSSQTNSNLVITQNGNIFTLYKNNSQLGTATATASTFTAPYTMYVGSSNLSGSGTEYPFYGYIYFIGFGADKNYVPAIVNNVAGMYDTYNDVFVPSISGTTFIAGPYL